VLREDASALLASDVLVTREDIARAKVYVLQAEESDVDALAVPWLEKQVGRPPNLVDLDSPTARDDLKLAAKGYSLRLALYQAVWELVAAGELIPAGPPETWEATLTGRTQRGSNGLRLDGIKCAYPNRVHRPPLPNHPSTDPDIFLNGLDCMSLHAGIQAAVEQALCCFRRGLYLPATVMLAAAAEGTWLECGLAIATKLGDTKLGQLLNNQYVGLARKVLCITKALDQPTGKALLSAAGEGKARIDDAVLWTTTLRDRRNTLHWGKARSFIAEHSDTASLLLATPMHLSTLESIRKACL